jgi:uncharacterized protein (DUF58 family)
VDWSAWWQDHRPFWVIYPTRRLAVVVCAASLLWLVPRVGQAMALSAVALLTLLVLADYFSLPGRRHVLVRREIHGTLGLGDRVETSIDVESQWRWSVHVEATHELPATFVADRLPDAWIARGEARALPLIFTPTRRGHFDLGDVALRLTTRLGLVARIRRFRIGGTSTVVPSLANVRKFRLMALQHRLQDVGIRALRRRGEGKSFAGLRDYVPGDDPRNIDWKATARHGQMKLREFTIERSQTVVTLVDCGRAMTQLAGEFARIEHVLSAAMLLTDVAAVSGDQVGALAFDDEIRAFVPPQRGRAALGAVREALSAVNATMAEPDYASAFRTLSLRQRRRSLIVFFTDVMDARASRSLIAYLGRAAARHVVMIVAIRNEELIASTQPATNSAESIYLAAAAEELVLEREEALARMRRAGVTVLDVPAQQMATAVVNRYLEIKARGLI